MTSKALSAGIWSTLERVGQQGVQVLVLLVLARLLGPEAFGLIAMLTIFYGIAEALVNSGFGSALIQKKQITSVDCNSVFFLNITIGILMAGLMCLASPWIAEFYEEPVLQPMTCWLALMPIINSFGLVHTTLLRRNLQFRKLLFITMPATVISGLIGIMMALSDCGVWSLVAQMLSMRFLWVCLLWRSSGWRPRLEYSGQSITGLFGFGSKVMAEGLLNVVVLNLYYLLVGKIFDTHILGLFFHARRLQKMIIGNVSTSLNRISLPLFSQIQEDKERIHRGLHQANRLIAMTIGITCAFMFAVADPVFRGVLGNEWIDSISYFQWLSVAGLFAPIIMINRSIMLAVGRSDMSLWLSIFIKVLNILNLIIGYSYGIMALIYGIVIIGIVSHITTLYLIARLFHISIQRQFLNTLPSWTMAAVTCMVMLSIGAIIRGFPYLLIVLIQVFAGLTVWLAIGYAFGVQSLTECVQLVKQKVNQRKQARVLTQKDDYAYQAADHS